jgi:hypothetical protein
MDIEKLFKRIILLNFLVGFIFPFVWVIIKDIREVSFWRMLTNSSAGEIVDGNVLFVTLMASLIYLVSLYLLYKFNSIGKKIYVPILAFGYGSFF